MKKYLWVSEKIINGIRYTLLRNDDNPKDVIIRYNDKEKEFNIRDWSEFNGY